MMELNFTFGKKVCVGLAVCLLTLLPTNSHASQVVEEVKSDSLAVVVTGFRSINVSGSANGILKRKVVSSYRKESGFTETDVEGKIIGRKNAFNYMDTVPVTLAEVCYQYIVVDDNGNQIAASCATSKEWPEELFPEVVLPQHPDWVALYKKGWKLNWDYMVTSTALPARFAHNYCPDNDMNYIWDACINSLYQRYGGVSGIFPAMQEIDNLYAQQVDSTGYILRYYRWTDYASHWGASKETPRIGDVNPPLFAWAEWNYFEIANDTTRLKEKLPKIIKYYMFIENYLQEAPGKYVWNGAGSGWDNISGVQPHKYWVELPAMQALAAKYIAKMAKVLGHKDVVSQFTDEANKKGKELEEYWNKDKNWYCSIGENGDFTGKTISGMWSVLSGYVSQNRIKKMIKENLFNPQRFYTTMPLPTIAKDENGYNPKGEYWRGSVWIPMSTMVIRGLDEQGFSKEAFMLSEKTMKGMTAVYDGWEAKPHSLWECYAPEYPAPASHKNTSKIEILGTVRSDFAGWCCGVINFLIENVMGFHVDAPNNIIHWNIRLDENYGIKRLVFGKTKTDIQITDGIISVDADAPYVLLVNHLGKEYRYSVNKGNNKFKL